MATKTKQHSVIPEPASPLQMRCEGEGRGASVRAVHLPRRCAWPAAPRRPLWRASLWAPSEGTAAPPERDETPWGEEKQLCDTDSCTHWYMWKSIISSDHCRLLATAAIAQLRIYALVTVMFNHRTSCCLLEFMLWIQTNLICANSVCSDFSPVLECFLGQMG